jgi:hypothetical protein
VRILRQGAQSRLSLRPFVRRLGQGLDQTLYHLMLDGRPVGPYDARTIIGMRVKKTLADDSVLIRPDGSRVTVEEIVRGSRREFDPARSGTHSLVKASYEAGIVQCERRGPLPRYDGPMEVRVQSDVLRIAGQLRGKDDRVKLAFADVVHVRARNALVDLWLRGERATLQAATLRMMSPEAARELVGWLPGSTAPPPEVAVPRVRVPYGIVIAVAGAALGVLAVVLVLVLKR